MLIDISVFIHSQEIIMTLYVDNMLILAKSLKKIEWIKSQIKKIYIIKNLGVILKILGIYMTY